jgi:uroporphyrinogen-III synthase
LRVLVTRPRAQAEAWVGALAAHGIDAVALPLIAIGPAPDPGAVAGAWSTLGRRALVVFVSPSAATAFFAAAPAHAGWPGGVRAGAPGPGTADTLRELGVPEEAIDAPDPAAAQFDSEALWASLAARDWCGTSVLLVRGTSGREALATQLRFAGARVEALTAYSRATPQLEAGERERLAAALAAPAQHAWLFSSAEAIDRLVELVAAGVAAGSLDPGVAQHADWSAARAVCTHPRIAARARTHGFGRVHEARATLDAVVACIQSLRP